MGTPSTPCYPGAARGRSDANRRSLPHQFALQHPGGYIRFVPDESLLTDEVRALIGRRTELSPVRVTLRDVKRATEVYYGAPGPDFAEGDVVPGYVIAVLDPETDPPELPRLLPQSLLISNEWSFERYPRLGETLYLTSVVSNISERFGGRFGYSLDFRSTVEFRDSNGALVATSSNGMMQYDASTAEGAE